MDNNLYKVINSKNKFTDFGEYSRLYLFTTENIKGYLKYFDLNGKNILTPTSSGDHAFESILKGARSVDMFDINKYSKYMVKLKIAAIKALERGEFLEYFLVKYNNHNNDYVFNKKTYKKIRKYLDNETKNFFDEAYEIAKTGFNLRNSSLFYNNRNDERCLRNKGGTSWRKGKLQPSCFCNQCIRYVGKTHDRSHARGCVCSC